MNSQDLLTQKIIAKLKSYTSQVESGFTGEVTEVGDGVAQAKGLENISY
ncbi:hypothetical protein HYW54_00330, partial [Candidatus Gottesmanbacteria bacterium]|nr:hypothetical protein [Candidatus Gottesmanbacteria bacterium]